MKGHHDESKLAMQTPPQEQHFESDAELDNIVEHLDELEARSGPSAKRRLSMHWRVQSQRGGILWIPSLFKTSRTVPAKRRVQLMKRRRSVPSEML